MLSENYFLTFDLVVIQHWVRCLESHVSEYLKTDRNAVSSAQTEVPAFAKSRNEEMKALAPDKDDQENAGQIKTFH